MDEDEWREAAIAAAGVTHSNMHSSKITQDRLNKLEVYSLSMLPFLYYQINHLFAPFLYLALIYCIVEIPCPNIVYGVLIRWVVEKDTWVCWDFVC